MTLTGKTGECLSLSDAAVLLRLCDSSQGQRMGGMLCILPAWTDAAGNYQPETSWVEYGPNKDDKEPTRCWLGVARKMERLGVLKQSGNRGRVIQFIPTESADEHAQAVWELLQRRVQQG